MVSDEDNKPIEDAWMMIFVNEAGVGDDWSHTDEEGACSVLLPSEEYLLRVGCDGFESRYVGPFQPQGTPEEVLVTLVREPVLRGVVLAEGKPVAGAEVRLEYTFGEGHRSVNKGFTSRFFGSQEKVMTDSEGRFAAPLAEPEDRSWSLLVQAEGYASSEYLVGQVGDVSGEPEITIHLTRGGALEGRVVAGSTRDLGGIIVGCSREDGFPKFTRTDANGFYRFEHLTPGPWVLEDRERMPEGGRIGIVRSEEMPFEPNVQIREGETTTFDLDVRWKENLAVHGHLSFDGKPAHGWTALVDMMGSLEVTRRLDPVVLDAQGNFTAPAVPGSASLVLRSPAGEEVERVIDWKLTIGPNTGPVEIELKTGTVRGSGHEPGTDLRFSKLLESGAVTFHTFVADDQGAFEVSGVPTGDLRLLFKKQRGWEVANRFHLDASQALTLD